ncbi:DUF427 domain-containing protein [Salinimicrobium soli]|uniref:DUF427 domain-containing protein n=1 Tax=Salinimicrobium soli TaxID=1254399 RepID=UPI003AAD5DC7
MKAIWKDAVLAESNNTKVIDNTHYFPPDSLNSRYFQLSDTHSESPQEGRASYFHIQVEDQKKEDAAWFYPHPKEAASEIKNHVAFTKEIEIED